MMTSNMDLEHFYDYLFHYNPYEKLWYAFKRDGYNEYFSGKTKKNYIMKHEDLGALTNELLINNTKKNDKRKERT